MGLPVRPLGRCLVLVVFGIILKPTGGLALSGATNAFLACRDPLTGSSIHVFKGPQAAAYQFNAALVAQLHARGASQVELSGIGRSIDRVGLIFASNYKPAFWFTLRREDGRIVLDAFSHLVPKPTGKALATFIFPTRNCQI